MDILINDKKPVAGWVSIRQYNNDADTVTFSVDATYNDVDLSDATARLAFTSGATLIAGSSDHLTQAVEDDLITVTWLVSRDYTETAGTQRAQLSFLDVSGVAVYECPFVINILDSVEWSEWDGDDTTIWDDYLAQFAELTERAETAATTAEEAIDTIDDKLEAFGVTGLAVNEDGDLVATY